MAFNKQNRRFKIKKRIRKNLVGTSERPRLSVFRSNNEIYAQIINDETGQTIVASSSKELKVKGTKMELSQTVGKSLAEKALSNGISHIVFDRSGYLYHGRVKALADGAREGGLQF